MIITQSQVEIKLIHNNENLYWIKANKLESLTSEDYALLLEKFNAVAKEKKLEIITDTSFSKEKINVFFNQSILSIVKQKSLFIKQLNNHHHVPNYHYEYIPISKFSEDEILNIFSEIIQGDHDMSFDANQEFEDLKEMTENHSYLKDWKVVFFQSEKIGMVLPHKYLDDTNEGTLLYIGLVPKFRNNGFAKEIHSQGLQFLKEKGVEKYYGSTMKNNKAMLRIFEKNECELEREQFFYK